MAAEDFVGQQCEGAIKSFSVKSSYGFISCESFPEDVFVSFKLAPELEAAAGKIGDLTGQQVSFILARNPKKEGSYEAQEVSVSIDGSAEVASADAYVGQWCRGTFKSFSMKSGWGFLTCPNFADDVFVGFNSAPELRDIAMQLGSLQDQKVTFLLQESKTTQGRYEAGGIKLVNNRGPTKGGVMQGGMMCKGAFPGMMMMAKGAMMAQAVPTMKGNKAAPKSWGGSGPSVGQRVSGWFKSFNATKGWGFLRCDKVAEDIFVSLKTAPELRDVMQQFPSLEGLPVTFQLQPSKSGNGSFEASQVSPASVGKGGYGKAHPQKAHSPAGPYAMTPSAGPTIKPKKTIGAPGGGAKDFLKQRVSGHVKSFSQQSRWGFVKADAFADDCFFNLKNNAHLEAEAASIQANDPVTFVVEASRSRLGAFEAVEVSR
mmetsp:Transcript_20595/g.57266  ORF Transcript_20595/g.57266 Transcript_20595/m.57266 type:complete len:429 (-) Transcript_20595:96-1382(-)